MKRLVMVACLVTIASAASAQFDPVIVPQPPTSLDTVVYRYTIGDLCIPTTTHQVAIHDFDIDIREILVNAEACTPIFHNRDVVIGQLAPGTYTVRYYRVFGDGSEALQDRLTLTFTVASAPIPTVSEWGLAAVVIGLGVCAVFALRR